MSDGWIGVDLDGTLAHYDRFVSPTHIGAPIPVMMARVKTWLAEGREVRIVTARCGGGSGDERSRVIEAVKNWCLEHVGRKLTVTNAKDWDMIVLYDDRCIRVEKNTGRLLNAEQK